MNETPETSKPISHSRANPVGATLFISLGILLLFNNFGWLPWSTWDVVWRFWPALLIIGGLQMVLGKSLAARLIVALVTVAVILSILFYVLATTTSPASDWFKNRYPNFNTPNYISYPHPNWN